MDDPDPIRAFYAQVDRVVGDSGYRYERAAAVNGIETDYLVWAPNGESFLLLEVKPLIHDRGQMAKRSEVLATRIREQVGARRVLLVTPYPVSDSIGLESDALRFVEISALASTLAAEFRAPSTYVASLTADAVVSHGRVFAAMPFANEFDDVFFVAIAGASEHLGLAAYRVDYDDYSGDVVTRIKDAIRESRVVVVDLTRQRPNVLFEMGFAMAIGIPVIPICADDLSKLPFDVAHENTMAYRLGMTTRLLVDLEKRLGSVLGITPP